MKAKIIGVLILALILIAWLAPAASAASPIYVRPGGDDVNCDGTADVDYPGSGGPGLACAVQAIQKGVDLVDDNGTVYVRAGAYTLPVVVNLTKPGVTLDGDGPGATIVQVSGAGDRINIAASGVTVQDLEIVKTDKTGEQNIVRLTSGNNITIKNNTIHGQFVIGENDVSRAMVLNAGAMGGVNIEGNTIYALRQPAYISGTHTGTIQNNYVYGTKGWVLEGGNLTFTGNTWGSGADANVYDVAILATMPAGYYADIVAMSDANNGAVIEDQRVSPAVLSVVYVDAATSYTTDLGGRYHPYATISPAITRAAPGATIHIAAGTYPETVNIEGKTGLTLNGADKLTTIIKPTSTLGWNVGTYGTSRLTTFRVVNSTDITVQNLTIDCDLVKTNFLWPTMFWDSTGTLNNNIIENTALPDASGGYYEFGSAFRAPGFTDGARANITVSNNVYKDTGRVAIHAHDYVHLTISGNEIYKTTADFGYGMEIGSQSTATITGNVIHGYNTPAASDGSQSGGIYIENAFTGAVTTAVAKNVSLTGNEIYDCQWALYIGNEFNGYAGNVDIVVTATGNNLHDNTDGAVAITDEDKAAGSSVTYTGSGNTVTNNGGDGYYIYTGGDGDVTVSLDHETITGQAVGIHLEDTGAPSNSSYNIGVQYSNLSGNTSYGIQNEYSGATIDAEHNYWGTVAFSEIVPQVSGAVDWNPWCNSDFSVCTYVWPVHNVTQGVDYLTIQAAIDAANPGDVIEIDAGTYDIAATILVNKAVTLRPTAGATVVLRGTNSAVISILEISASNVTIQGLEITHSALPAFVPSGWIELPNSLIRVPVSLGVSGIAIQGNTLYVPAQSGAMSTWNGVAITVGSGTTTGITISGNTIHNTRNGVVVQGNNTATVSNNIIYATKGGVMNYTATQADADNRTVSGNAWGATHNEWDIVWNSGSYYTVTNQQAGILALSAANNGAYVLDRRGPDAAAVSNLTGNRSHIFVDAASSILASHPARGNMNEPFQNLDLAWQAVVPGGTIYVASDGTYALSAGTHPGGLVVTGDDVVITGPGAIDCGTAGGVGILVQGGADNLILDGAQITGCTTGVELAGIVDSFKLVNNWIHTNTGNGLLIDSGAGFVEDSVVTIEGNLFKDNGGNGIQNDSAATVPAEYNSWGHIGGPSSGDGIGGPVDADPFTFAETFLDIVPDTLATERHVAENTSFNVALKADAVNLYGLTFRLAYDPARFTVNSVTFASPWSATGRCQVWPNPNPAGVVGYNCQLYGGDAEWSATAGTIATINLTAKALPSDAALTTYLDLSPAAGDTSAGAIGGQKVFVNNAGYNAPSVPARDITDTDDGKIIVERLASYKGYVDLQGRANDSGATVEIHVASTYGSTLLASATSGSSGSYTTASIAPNWLAVGTTYWFQIDRPLYLPTTVLAPPAATYGQSKVASVPLTTLTKVVLLGGDATNNNEIDVGDLTCIGGDYGKTSGFTACGGTGLSDVNGDNAVNIQDLSLSGGNLYKESSPWTP